MDDQNIEQPPQELENNFKRRKIEEWKQRMGFTLHGTGTSGGGGGNNINDVDNSSALGHATNYPSPYSSSSSTSSATHHAPVIDLQAIKKQIEERKKMALENLKMAKSNKIDHQESIPTLLTTALQAPPTSSTSTLESATKLQSTPKTMEPIYPKVSHHPSTKLELIKPNILKDKENAYFDSSLGIPTRQKRRRSLKFIYQGKFIQKGQKLRAEAKLQALKLQVSESMKKSRVGAHLNFITEKTGKKEPPPLIEWWDLPFSLSKITYEALIVHWKDPTFSFRDTYTTASPPVSSPSTNSLISTANDTTTMETIKESTSSSSSSLKPPLISSLIFHPKLLPSVCHIPVLPRPVMLTKQERKKLRRQRRLEEQKEKQDKIRLGLLPPEQPKVRIANLMRVLQNEAIQDPTKVEAQVRHQMEQRKKKHELDNQARQLTKEQKREKVLLQIKSDINKGLHACIFKWHPRCTTSMHKAKIYHNVTQLGLAGIGVFFEDHHVVVVEGGEKSLRHFKKLMLRRIQWQMSFEDANLSHSEQLRQSHGQSETSSLPSSSLHDPSILRSESDDDDDGLGTFSDRHQTTLTRHYHQDLGMSKLISGIGGNGIDGSGGVGPVSIGSNFSLPLNKTFCWLLWEGDIGQHAFQGFKFKQCHTEKQVTELFASVHVEHYWDLAKNWIMPGLI